MVQFPETAATEWKIVSEAAFAAERFLERLKHEAEVEKRLKTIRVDHEAKLLLQAEIDSGSTPTLEMGSAMDYMTGTAASGPADLIEGAVKDNSTCIMMGPAGAGKSTLAMQAIHSWQTGAHWMGQPAKILTGGFGILSYDMDASMLVATLAPYPGVDMGRVHIVNAHKRGHPLAVPALRAQIASKWRSENVEVVIVDSFSASFFGHDQNDAASTMSHYRDLGTFALTEVGARVLIVLVHSTKNNPDTVRGSTVHHDVADSIVVVSADQKTGARHVRMAKYRAAPGQHQMGPVMIGAMDPVTNLIDLDTGAMSLSGMSLPPSAVDKAFPVVHEDPDTTTDGDDDL